MTTWNDTKNLGHLLSAKCHKSIENTHSKNHSRADQGGYSKTQTNWRYCQPATHTHTRVRRKRRLIIVHAPSPKKAWKTVRYLGTQELDLCGWQLDVLLIPSFDQIPVKQIVTGAKLQRSISEKTMLLKTVTKKLSKYKYEQHWKTWVWHISKLESSEKYEDFK